MVKPVLLEPVILLWLGKLHVHTNGRQAIARGGFLSFFLFFCDMKAEGCGVDEKLSASAFRDASILLLAPLSLLLGLRPCASKDTTFYPAVTGTATRTIQDCARSLRTHNNAAMAQSPARECSSGVSPGLSEYSPVSDRVRRGAAHAARIRKGSRLPYLPRQHWG